MTAATSTPLARLISPFVKPALTLVGAFLVGGASGAGWWQSGADWASATWDGSAADAYYIGPWSDVEISFSELYNDTATLFVGQGDSSNHTVTFAATDPTKGLDLTGGLTIAFPSNTKGDLVLDEGAYTVTGDVNLGTEAGSTASLKINDGASLSAGGNFNFANGTSTLTVDGGTMTVSGASTWCWTDQATGNATVSILNGGSLVINGVYDDGDAINAIWGSGGQQVDINVDNGSFSVPNGDMMLGAYGTWDNTSGNVSIDIGNGGVLTCGSAQTAKKLVLGRFGSESYSVNVGAGGVLKAGSIQRGGNGTAHVTINGGTIEVLGVHADGFFPNSGIALAISSNGGSINVGANNATIAAAVNGAGAIIKKGSGTLTLSGDLTGFTGMIQVREGSVVVPSASSSIAAGPSTLKTVTDNTTVFTSVFATAFEFDFEDSSMSGWTAKEYNEGAKGSSSIGSRNLVVANKKGKTTSNFYRYQSDYGGSGDRGATITYNLSADTSALSDYTLEMDWFAVQNGRYLQQSSHDVGLTFSSASGAVVAVLANPDSAVTGNFAGVYLNGATTASGTIATAAPYGDCTGDTNQQYWYHAILKASETDGVTFTILKNDGTVAFSETRVCDYIKITQIKLDAHRVRVNNTSKGGIDDVVISVPAKALFCGIGYKTLQDAVNVAAASSETTKTVTLLDNVTENITLSTPGTVVSLGAFAITGTVSAGSGMVVDYDDATKSWTCEADISTYTWTNAKGNNSWQDPENWMAGSTTATVAPSADTTVLFPSAVNAWPVELTEKGYAKQIQANGDVVLTGALIALNDTAENGVVGTGKVTLGNNSGFEVTTGTLTIANPVEITAAAAHQA